MEGSRRRVVFVQGTTASGKSDWALRLAEKYQGVIVNCDSIQVYQKLDIGSAKPSAEEQARAPHYLFDYVQPPRELTAGKYSRDFYQILETIPEERPIFVVGGTGFYFLSIEKGMYPIRPVDPEVQKQVAREIAQEGGAERLFQEVQLKDPTYAAKLHLADHYRIGRAVEIIRTENRSITEIQQELEAQQKPFPYPLLKIAPRWDREVLAARIQKRVEQMVQMGLVDEVQKLLDEGWGDWAPLQSVGYRETLAFLKGDLAREDLVSMISQNTRQLAKKQRTWFQRDAELLWFEGDSGWDAVSRRVEEFLGVLTP